MNAQQKVTVEIGGSIAASLGKSLRAAQTQVSSFGRNVDRAVGDSMKSARDSVKGLLGSGLFQLSAGAGVAFGAITTGLFKLGTNFDQAFDTIRAGTGATGKALDGLKNDFREVFRSTPADMQTVGQAIADLNTRTGLVGAPLQALTRQMVNLEQVGQGLATENIPTLTRVLGDWSIAADETGSKMDYLFRGSQATGPSMAQIGENLVKYGAPLRQLNFSFEQSVAMLGKFEKEGVNTELVMGSLRISLGKMAKAGVKDVPAAFAQSVKAIKEAGTVGEANAKALALFGAKAGPDMAAAIREGRFEIDELVKQLVGSKDTINSVAFETADAAEKFRIIRNDMAVALEPMANNVFAALGDTLEKLKPTIKTITNEIAYFAKQNPQAATAIIGLTAGFLGLVAISPMIVSTIAVVSTLSKVVAGLKIGATIAGFLPAILNPIGLIIAGVVLVGAALVAAYKYFPWFRNAVNAVWGGIVARFQAAIGAIKAGWQGFTTYLGGAWKVFTGVFTGDLGRIKEGFGQAFSGIKQIAKAWLGWFRSVLPSGVRGVFDRVVSFIKETPGKVASVGGMVIEAIINGLKAKAGALFGWIRNTWSNITGFFGGGAAPAPAGGAAPARTPSSNPRAGQTGIYGTVAPPGRALGGPVTAGMPYIVGEKRRELFVPGMDGAIIPRIAKPAAGGNNITINAPVTINATGDGAGIRDQVRAAFEDLMAMASSGYRVALND